MNTNEPTAATEAPVIAALMLRGELFATECPWREVLQHVTSRWGVLVLVALLAGTHRFSDLRRKIGGESEKMLAQTLQWLAGDGFVLRTQYPVVVPHVEYSLTPMGVEAARQVVGLADWIEGNLARILSEWRARADALAARSRPSVRAGVRTLVLACRGLATFEPFGIPARCVANPCHSRAMAAVRALRSGRQATLCANADFCKQALA